MPKLRTQNLEPRTPHDRCPEKSVIFDPPICHGLNGIMKLSHTHALPPISSNDEASILPGKVPKMCPPAPPSRVAQNASAAAVDAWRIISDA